LKSNFVKLSFDIFESSANSLFFAKSKRLGETVDLLKFVLANRTRLYCRWSNEAPLLTRQSLAFHSNRVMATDLG